MSLNTIISPVESYRYQTSHRQEKVNELLRNEVNPLVNSALQRPLKNHAWHRRLSTLPRVLHIFCLFARKVNSTSTPYGYCQRLCGIALCMNDLPSHSRNNTLPNDTKITPFRHEMRKLQLCIFSFIDKTHLLYNVVY